MEHLPEEFTDALQDYNAEVATVFSQYLITVATEHERQRGEEKQLPLSGICKKKIIPYRVEQLSIIYSIKPDLFLEWLRGSFSPSVRKCYGL